MTRVLVAAASAVVRAGLEAIIRGSEQLEVAGSASGLTGLAEQIEAAEPDVVLVELERGDGRLAPALPAFEPQPGPPALVVLIGETGEVGVAEVLRLGARAVLPRDAQPEEIVASIEAAAAGLIVLHPSEIEALLPHIPSSDRGIAANPGETLTPREIEVLSMIAEGAGNKSIARRLGISEHTVKFHVGSILAKLNASSRTEAVTLGMRRGLIMV